MINSQPIVLVLIQLRPDMCVIFFLKINYMHPIPKVLTKRKIKLSKARQGFHKVPIMSIMLSIYFVNEVLTELEGHLFYLGL